MLKFDVVPFCLVYDGEDDDATAKAAAEKVVADKAAADKAAAEGGKSYTQDQLNKLMADNRRKLTQQNGELVTELTALKDQANLTTQAKTELEDRIEKLQEQTMTQEEIAKRNAKKAAKDHDDALGKVTTERDNWRNRYTSERVTTELLAAAGEAKAAVASQMVNILGPNTILAEKTDEAGKLTGEYETLVKFADVDGDGKPVTLNLAPAAAMKRMKELPEQYGNLFINPGTGGVGGTSGAGSSKGKQMSVKDLIDTDNYQAWRKKNPGADPTAYKG
jgi:hypothetical protein